MKDSNKERLLIIALFAMVMFAFIGFTSAQGNLPNPSTVGRGDVNWPDMSDTLDARLANLSTGGGFSTVDEIPTGFTYTVYQMPSSIQSTGSPATILAGSDFRNLIGPITTSIMNGRDGLLRAWDTIGVFRQEIDLLGLGSGSTPTFAQDVTIGGTNNMFVPSLITGDPAYVVPMDSSQRFLNSILVGKANTHAVLFPALRDSINDLRAAISASSSGGSATDLTVNGTETYSIRVPWNGFSGHSASIIQVNNGAPINEFMNAVEEALLQNNSGNNRSFDSIATISARSVSNMGAISSFTTADLTNASGQTYNSPNGSTFTASTGTRTQSYLNTLVRQRLNATIDTLNVAKARIAVLESASVVSAGGFTVGVSAPTGTVTSSAANYTRIGSVVTWTASLDTYDTDGVVDLTFDVTGPFPGALAVTNTTLQTSRNQLVVVNSIGAEILSATTSTITVRLDRDDSIDNDSPVTITVTAQIL